MPHTSTLLACLALALSGCVTERKDSSRLLQGSESVESLVQAMEKEEKAIRAASPEIMGPPPLEELMAHYTPKPGERVLFRSNGDLSKFFSVRSGRGAQFRGMLLKYCDLAEASVELIDKADIAAFRDPRNAASGPPTNVDISDWIVVTGNESEIERAGRFLNLYYASVPQIEIEAKIAEVTSDNVKDLGVVSDVFNTVSGDIMEDFDPLTPGVQDPPPNFGAGFNQSHVNLPNTVTTASGTPASILVRAIVGKTELKAALQMLATQRNVDIVSSPRIAVRNGGKAEIVNGEEIPFVNITSFSPSQTTFSGSVQYRQTGVKLYIVPYLAGSDTIFLNVEAEVSTPSGFTNVGGISNPIIVTRNAKTDVHIREGSTFVIGGLISSADTEIVKKVPLLGDIPLVGMLFRSTFKQKVFTEVLFFITPRVIYRETSQNELLLP